MYEWAGAPIHNSVSAQFQLVPPINATVELMLHATCCMVYGELKVTGKCYEY